MGHGLIQTISFHFVQIDSLQVPQSGAPFISARNSRTLDTELDTSHQLAIFPAARLARSLRARRWSAAVRGVPYEVGGVVMIIIIMISASMMMAMMMAMMMIVMLSQEHRSWNELRDA